MRWGKAVVFARRVLIDTRDSGSDLLFVIVIVAPPVRNEAFFGTRSGHGARTARTSCEPRCDAGP